MTPNDIKNQMIRDMYMLGNMNGPMKPNAEALREACGDFLQMLQQKTAGQRADKPKDISWENLERAQATIIIETLALYENDMLGWVNARDRLPRDGEGDLIFVGNENCERCGDDAHIGCYMDSYFTDYFDGYYCAKGDDVDWWMRVPERR